jgi:hypothetical protein
MYVNFNGGSSSYVDPVSAFVAADILLGGLMLLPTSYGSLVQTSVGMMILSSGVDLSQECHLAASLEYPTQSGKVKRMFWYLLCHHTMSGRSGWHIGVMNAKYLLQRSCPAVESTTSVGARSHIGTITVASRVSLTKYHKILNGCFYADEFHYAVTQHHIEWQRRRNAENVTGLLSPSTNGPESSGIMPTVTISRSTSCKTHSYHSISSLYGKKNGTSKPSETAKCTCKWKKKDV